MARLTGPDHRFELVNPSYMQLVGDLDLMGRTVLESLREAQASLRRDGPIARLATFVTHYDGRIAREAWSAFEPAVPTSPEAFVLGLAGFIFGGGVIHIAGHPLRRRVRAARAARQTERTA